MVFAKLFMHRQRPALARMVRNSNGGIGRLPQEHLRPDSGKTDVSLDTVLDRIRTIPPSAMSRMSGSPTVFAH